MEKQVRKFTLGEVNTRMGTMGEVRFDQTLLHVLGVKPGDFLVFSVSTEGTVTVTGEKKPTQPLPTILAKSGVAGIISSEVTQPVLFDTGQPIKPPRQRRRTI